MRHTPIRIYAKQCSILLLVLVLVQACSWHRGDRTVQKGYYTCRMHPNVRLDHPGVCPICGMRLIPMHRTADTLHHDDPVLLEEQESPDHVLVGSFPTTSLKHWAPAAYQNIPARVVPDPDAAATISMEVDGRIEHSYVHILHQRVHKGDLLFDLYSPELLALQRQYLQSLNSGDSNLARVQADNLQHLGMDAAALIHLRKVRQPNPYLKVYSPLSGIVEPWSVQRFSRTMNVEWISMGQPGSDEAEAAPEWALYPGMYVHAGQKLFVVQSMAKPWVVLQIPASQAFRAAAGDSVVLKPLSGLGGSLRTTLDYVPLNVDATSQSSPVRIYLSELPPGWTLGMNLIAQWSPQTVPRQGAYGWYLPEGSLKWLGDRYVAWVQDARDSMLFRVQDVRVGTHSGGWYQILAGLDSSSRVVTEANLVQDNEIYIH